MLASCCLKTLKLIAGWPLMRAIESGSRSRSTSVPRSPSVSGRLPRCARRRCRRTPRVAHAAFDAQRSRRPRRVRSAGPPAGRRWPRAAPSTISAGVMRVGAQARAGRGRCAPRAPPGPPTSTRGRRRSTRCEPLGDDLVGRAATARAALRVLPTAAPCTTTGCALSLSKRATVGGLASRGKRDCTAATLVAHVLHRAVHVGVERELDAGLAAAFEAARA